MSLRAVHLFFIVMATLMAFLCGAWGIHYHLVKGSVTYFVVGLISSALGVVLFGYAIWFLKKIRRGRFS